MVANKTLWGLSNEAVKSKINVSCKKEERGKRKEERRKKKENNLHFSFHFTTHNSQFIIKK